MNDVSKLRQEFWKAFKQNAKGLDGQAVVDALYEASEEVWAAGLDARYGKFKNTSDLVLADAWDLGWLSAVTIKLWKRKNSKQKFKI